MGRIEKSEHKNESGSENISESISDSESASDSESEGTPVDIINGLDKTLLYTVISDGRFLNSISAPKIDGYTFYAFYYDEFYKNKVEFPVNLKENSYSSLYAEFICGENLVFIKNPEDLKVIGETENIYLLCDVDMSGITVSAPYAFRGKFFGNGFTVKNLGIDRTLSYGENYLGFFGIIEKDAEITDIFFENMTVYLTFGEAENDGTENYAGIIAGNIEEGALISDIKITGTLYYGNESKRSLTIHKFCGEFGGVGMIDGIYSDLNFEDIKIKSLTD